MQSNNTPNQIPDPAAPTESFMDLLNGIDTQEELAAMDRLLEEYRIVAEQVQLGTDGAGAIQLLNPIASGLTAQSAQSDQATSAQTISPTQMSSQFASGQPLLVTQMAQMTSVKQMAQMTSVKQMVVMNQTMQSGQIGQYDPSAQPILPLLMTQSPDASAQATSHVQTGGQASGGTQQDVLSENRRLHEENQKLLAENQKLLAENQKLLVENYFLNVGNGAFIKRVQELKLKVQELKLKVKGQVCLHDEMSYIYMDVMKCLLSIWL